MKGFWVLIAIAFVCLQPCCNGRRPAGLFANINIVRDGKAQAVIVVGTGAPWIDRHAAEELSKFIEDMTGARLDIVDADSYAGDNVNNLILIGRQETNTLIADLVAAGLTRYSDQEFFWHHWEKLSPREREITAYTCLGYTNKQIAARLSISPETVKTHVRNVLFKFDVHSKAKLRVMLASWDFSSWK